MKRIKLGDEVTAKVRPYKSWANIVTYTGTVVMVQTRQILIKTAKGLRRVPRESIVAHDSGRLGVLVAALAIAGTAAAQDAQQGPIAIPQSLTALGNAPAEAVQDAAMIGYPAMQALQTVWFAQRVAFERDRLADQRTQTVRLTEIRDQTAKLAAAVDALATWAKQPATGGQQGTPATTQPSGDAATLARIATALEAIQASQATQAQRIGQIQTSVSRINDAAGKLAGDFAATFKATTQPTTQPGVKP